MNRLAALGCIAVTLVFPCALSAQLPADSLSVGSAGGNGGVYAVTAQYNTYHPVPNAPSGNVTFRDTTYSNATLGSASFTNPSTISSINLVSSPNVGTSLTFYQATAKDFDGDGKVDVLLIDTGRNLEFIKGNGDGTFQTPQFVPSVVADKFVTDDFNSDGKLDLVVTSSSANTTSICLGNGDGTFQSPITLFSGRAVVAGDFNGDGKLDLYSYALTSASLYLGNGDGTFGSATASLVTAAYAVGDFNRDGIADIVGNYNVLLGQRDGTFQLITFLASSADYGEVGDFNGDGKLDFLAYTLNSGINNSVFLHLGNGDGTFQTETAVDVTPNSNWFSWNYLSFVVGDFNADGTDELAFLGSAYLDRQHAIDGSSFTYISLFSRKPDGSYSKSMNTINNNPYPSSMAGTAVAGDFYTGGGKGILGLTPIAPSNSLWVPVSTFTTNVANVSVWPQGSHTISASYPGDSSYQAVATTVYLYGEPAATNLSLSIAPTNIQGSSPADATITVTPCTVNGHSCTGNLVRLLDGLAVVGSGYPSATGVVHLTTGPLDARTHSFSARFNGDIYLAISTSNTVTVTATAAGSPGNSGTLSLTSGGGQDNYTLRGNFTVPVRTAAPTGNVAFTDVTSSNTVLATAPFLSSAPTLQVAATTPALTRNIHTLYAGDFDHDGISDMIYLADSGAVGLVRGAGDGTFALPTGLWTGSTMPFAVADFNNDGALDVVGVSSATTLLPQLNNGAGSFTAVAAIADNSDLTSPLLTGDFNGDGKQDIYNGTTHNVFFGNGDGSFQNAVTTAISAQVAGDFNGDGRTDLFTSSGVYLGQANGTFVAVPVASSYSPGVLVADFNGDGKTDVFTSDSTLLLGNGHGTFQTPLQVDLTTGTSDAVQNPRYFTGDFNGDGKQDVGVVLDSTSLHASIIVNTYGNGTGVFTNKVVTTVSQSYMQTVPPYVADFNGDGAADIPGFVNPIYTGDKSLTLYATNMIYTATATEVAVASPPDGAHSVAASYPGDTNYTSATSSSVTLIARTASTLTLAASSNPVDYGSHVTYTATLTTNTNAYSNGGTVNFYDGSTLLGSGTLLQGSATFLPPSLPIPGTHVITAKFVGDDNIKPAGSGPITVQVIHAPIQITWPNPTPISYGTALSATQLSATAVQVIGGAPVPGTFVYTPAAGTILGVGSHTLNVDFTPTDTVAYANIGTLSVGVTVNKATPSVAITQIAPASPGATIGVSATLQAAVTVSYGTPTGTVIFYDGTTQIASVIVSGGVATTSVTFSSAGTHAITAVYQGDGNFTTATSAIFNEVVTKATPAVTWSTPAAITYGTALSLTQLNATSTVAGTFVYSPAVGAVLGTGSQTLSVTFTPTDTATYNNATATTTLTVNKATPPITWPTPTTITFGTALSAAQLNAASSAAGTFSYTPAAGAVLGVGPQTLSVTFTPTDTTNYNIATATTTLIVNKATPSITWSTPAALSYGTALSAMQLNATSPVAGTFVYSPAAGTVLGAGSQTLSVSFTPTDTTTYNGSTTTTTLIVNKATPSITWPTPAAITYGTALSATQLNATSTAAGTFAYSPIAGTVPGAGSQMLSTTFTPTDTANYNSANGSTTLAVNKLTPSITVAQTSPITIGVGTGVATTFRANLAASYGTPLGTVGFYEGTTLLGTGTLINGAASVTTTFSSTGVHTVTALYTGDANFNSVTSAAFNETVVLFGIGLAANPTTLTIKQGQSGTATITATPTGNYAGTLTFSCGNLPSSVSCSFAPATLTFNGDNQPQTITITVSTRSTSAALTTSSSMRLASILALPLLAFGLRRRRMLQRGLLMLFAAMLLLPVSGCGGSPTTTSNSTATGQQTVTINAQTTANGGSTQSFNFSIVIEP